MINTVWNSNNDNRNYTNILDYFDPPETQKVILSAAINKNMEHTNTSNKSTTTSISTKNQP